MDIHLDHFSFPLLVDSAAITALEAAVAITYNTAPVNLSRQVIGILGLLGF